MVLPNPFELQSPTFWRINWTWWTVRPHAFIGQQMNCMTWLMPLQANYQIVWPDAFTNQQLNCMASCFHRSSTKLYDLMPLQVNNWNVWPDSSTGQQMNFMTLCLHRSTTEPFIVLKIPVCKIFLTALMYNAKYGPE